jgi:hypothetical protein
VQLAILHKKSDILRGMVDSNPPNTPHGSPKSDDGLHSSMERESLGASLLHHLWQYLSAIYEGWVSLVGGIAGIVLLILVVFLGDDYAFLRDNKKTFVWTAFICLVIAGFSAWRTERQKWERLGGLTALTKTPKELVSVFNQRTSTQGTKLSKHYIGKWLKVSGPLRDVESGTDRRTRRFVMTTLEGAMTDDEPLITMRFTKRKWEDLLSALSRGDTITVLGQIDTIGRGFALPNNSK